MKLLDEKLADNGDLLSLLYVIYNIYTFLIKCTCASFVAFYSEYPGVSGTSQYMVSHEEFQRNSRVTVEKWA